jgi:hypothetical protein
VSSSACSFGKALFSERSALPSIEFCKIMVMQRLGPPTFEHEDEDKNGPPRRRPASAGEGGRRINGASHLKA